MAPIYLDHAATTPLAPEVLDAMLPYLRQHFGNPSSIHSFGRTAKIALNDARDNIANHLNCKPGELIFTSGGTESDNLALFGVSSAFQGSGKKHIITSLIEHKAVLDTCKQLERLGFEVTYLPVDSTGKVRLEDLKKAVRPDTFLISIMYANNEVGTLQPIRSIGEWAREKGILFHVDAVQALGAVPLDLANLPVDLMSFSAHKINGPKGTGALYVAERVPLLPHIFGGSQERKRRAGTENVAGIVGFSAAVTLAVSRLQEKRAQMERLRTVMLDTLTDALGEDGFVVNGHETDRLGHILNVSFPGVKTETLLMNLDMEGIAASSGSACTSGALEVSHVLRAMRLPEEVVQSAVRFSFGWENREEEVMAAAQKASAIVRRLREKG